MNPLYRLYSTLTLLIALLVLLPAAVTGQPLAIDLTSDQAVAIWNSAIIQQQNVAEGAGTGILDPFYRLKTNPQAGVVYGANTGNQRTNYDTESGSWTTSLLLSSITQEERDEIAAGLTYRELILDVNQTSGNALYGIHSVKVFLDDQDNLNCYSPAGEEWSNVNNCPPAQGQGSNVVDGAAGSKNISKRWDLDIGPNGDGVVATDYRLEPGSGNTTDITFYIPDSVLDGYLDTGEDCSYGSPYGTGTGQCHTWVYVYSQFGEANEQCNVYTVADANVSGGEGTNAPGDPISLCPSDDGFEEWSTLVEPFVIVEKTANGTYDQDHTWTLTKTVFPDECDLFVGDECEVEYTITTTDDVETVNELISGEITLFVPETQPDGETTAITADVTSILDELFSDYDGARSLLGSLTAADLDCDSPMPGPVDPGQTVTCLYSFSGIDVADPGSPDMTNRVTVEVDLTQADFGYLADVGAYQLGTVTDGALDVDDDYGSADPGDDLGWTFPQVDDDPLIQTYKRTFACGEDQTVINTASATLDDQSTLEDDATVDINCYTLAVGKDANPSYSIDYDWTVEKSVDPDTWDLFVGDTGTSDYTIVVTKDAGTESAWAVTGTITITNNHPTMDADLTGVVDNIAGVGNAVVDCGGVSTVPADDFIQCTYSSDLPDKALRVNTATATQQNYSYDKDGVPSDNGTTDYQGTADVDFAGVTPSKTDDTASLGDDHPGASGLPANPISAGGEWSYSIEFACGEDEGQQDNTATLTPSDSDAQTSDAAVVVNCYDLDVDKDANPSFTRTFDWTVDKSVAPDAWSLFDGDSGTSEYTIVVTKDQGTDSDWAVEGTITITNNHPTLDADLTDVTDSIAGVGGVSVDCGGVTTVPADDSIQCSYSSDLPDAATRVNTATATLQNYDYESDGTATASGTTSYDGTADVDFSGIVPTLVNDEANLTDSYADAENLPVNPISTGGTYKYSRTFECGDDEGQHENIAAIELAAPIGGSDYDDNAIVDVDCYGWSIEKTAEPKLTTTYEWTVDKSVTPDSWALFDGESGTSEYTIVVTKDGGTDSGWAVMGDITITNNHPTRDLVLNSVSDEVSGPVAATIIGCVGDEDGDGDTAPYEVAADGGELVCSYIADLPDGTDRTNTGTAVQQNYDYDKAGVATAGGTTEHQGTADVDFADADETVVNPTANLEDSWDGATGLPVNPISAGGQWSYMRTFECGDDAGNHDNTATLTPSDAAPLQDGASVSVACYDIVVTKDATTSYTRTWDWKIDKWAEPAEGGEPVSSLNLAPGESYFLTYMIEVDLDGAAVDSDFHVTGSITVSNAGNPIAAEINSVEDLAPGAVAGIVDCGVTFPHTIAAGGSLVCSYDADLADASGGTNTATAALQLYDYASDLATTDAGSRDVDGTAAVTFGEPTSLVDECTDVSDPMFGGDLGQVCYTDTLPVVFDFDYEVAVTQDDCGEFTIDNTATETEVDNTDQVGTADWSILVTVNCPDGCTLTQGYWKTHNDEFWGGAPTDDNWENVSVYFDDGDTVAENEMETFFLSGDTWFGVFWTAPKGNAYYNLAHQWMAAWLNCVNTTDTPDCSSVQDVLDEARAWLETHTPGDVSKGKNKDPQLIEWAGTLGSFNEGLIGPGHCDENDISLFLVDAKVNVAGSVEAAVALDGVTETPTESKGDVSVKAAAEDEAMINEVSRVDMTPAPAAIEIPTEFSVGNYPNPFNPTTTIQVALPEASQVRVAVYDVLGRMVTMLVDGQLSAGTHSVTFDAGSLPSGVYLYRFEHSGGAITKTMQLLK